MDTRRRRSHAGRDTTPETIASARESTRSLLKKYLVHTREVPNGKDFLFLGPREVLHDALQGLVDLERKGKRFDHVDFAEVDAYFLLRIAGTESVQHIISKYFD